MKPLIILTLLAFFTGGLISCNQSATENIPVYRTDQSAVKNSDKAGKQIIIDVRTVEEWEQDGHAECTVNMPLDEIEKHISELKSYDDVIIVCRSGNRAEAAKSILEQQGIRNITNKGSWRNVNCSP